MLPTDLPKGTSRPVFPRQAVPGPGWGTQPTPRPRRRSRRPRHRPAVSPGRAALTARLPRECPPRPPAPSSRPTRLPVSPAGSASAGPRRRCRRARERVPRAELPGSGRPRLASAPQGGPRRRPAAESGCAQTGFSCSRPNRQATPRGGAGRTAGRGLASRPAPSRPIGGRAGWGGLWVPGKEWRQRQGWPGIPRAPAVRVFCRPGAARRSDTEET